MTFKPNFSQHHRCVSVNPQTGHMLVASRNTCTGKTELAVTTEHPGPGANVVHHVGQADYVRRMWNKNHRFTYTKHPQLGCRVQGPKLASLFVHKRHQV